MHHVKGHAVGQQCVDHSTLGRRGGNPVHAAQEQRMMRNDKIRTPLDRLGSHGRNRVNREENPAYRGGGIATDQTHRVPRLGPRRIIKLLEASDDLGKAWHGGQATAACSDGGLGEPRVLRRPPQGLVAGSGWAGVVAGCAARGRRRKT